MAEYIKKADVVKLCEDHSEYCFDNCDFLGASDFERLQKDIGQLPTADVVECVRIAKLTDAVVRIANILIERRTALSLSLNKCLELEAIITDLGKEKKDGNSTTSD